MLKGRNLISLFAALSFVAASFVFSVPAEAKVTVYKKGEAKLQLGFRLQSRLRLLGESETDVAAGTTTGRDYQFDFRRARIALGGQVNKLVKFFAQTDIGSGTGQPSTTDGGMELRDAFITLDFASTAKLSFGLFKTQFTRSRNGSGFGQMALDRPFVESLSTMTANVDSSIGGKRDQQIALWGNKDKFQYRLAVADGAATVGGKSDTLRYNARVHYAFWDAEKGFGYKETYHGTKKILTLGAGYDSQADVYGSATNSKNNTAYTVDLTYEQQLPGGGVPNANIAYYSRDIGANSGTSAVQGNGFHIALGYLVPGGHWQPYARYSTWDADLSGSDLNITNVGVNYLIKGHAAKLVFDLESLDFETDGATKATKDHTIVTMQWQADF